MLGKRLNISKHKLTAAGVFKFNLKQITNSIKLPISINAPESQYDYFNYFALLNKNALKKSIDIDFDMLCTERGIAREDVENRYIFALNGFKNSQETYEKVLIKNKI